MKKMIVLGAIVLSMGITSSAFAGGYGAAGCGVGNLIFQGKQDKVSQILAATTNGTLANQTFGISTGTLNCDATGLVVASKEADTYSAKNYDSLTKEMAIGSGEHLDTLAGLLNCDKAKLGAYSRAHYSEIFASNNTTSTEMLSALVKGLGSNS